MTRVEPRWTLQLVSRPRRSSRSRRACLSPARWRPALRLLGARRSLAGARRSARRRRDRLWAAGGASPTRPSLVARAAVVRARAIRELGLGRDPVDVRRRLGAPTSRPISPAAASAGRSCGRASAPRRPGPGFVGGLAGRDAGRASPCRRGAALGLDAAARLCAIVVARRPLASVAAASSATSANPP